MGYNPEIQGTKPDLPRARRLLAEAGYPQGFSVRLDGPNDHYRNDGEILKNVALQLGRVGIRVEVNGLPKERFFALQERSLSRFYLFGWSCETLQAGEALDSLIHSPAGGKGSENSQFLQDPALDRLIDDADKAGDLDAKVELLRTALARVASLRPILPLVVPKETFALSRSISWEPPLDGALRVVDVRAADPARPPSPPGP
jgi:peptide/nickel transport system substrate-binding protein